MKNRRTSFVDNPSLLNEALRTWEREATLAVDTESNSFFAYRERTCLVQVSTQDADWILDPFAVDLKPLGELMEAPEIEKVFHAGEFDVLSLKRDYGFVFNNLFDTLIAAKALGRRKLGLASLAEELLGISLEKGEQRSDWGRRPLSDKQIAYAYADTRHLLRIAAHLKEQVEQKGDEIVREVNADFERLTQKEPRPRLVDPDAYLRHKSARNLDPLSRQVLRSLFHIREERAQQADRPLFRIASDAVLGEIAARRPTSMGALRSVPGMSPLMVRRYGEDFLGAIREALELGPLEYPRRKPSSYDPEEESRHETLRAWRKSLAAKRGVEVDVIFGNAALSAIASANPGSLAELEEIDALDSFRLEKYGEGILKSLKNAPPLPSRLRKKAANTKSAKGN